MLELGARLTVIAFSHPFNVILQTPTYQHQSITNENSCTHTHRHRHIHEDQTNVIVQDQRLHPYYTWKNYGSTPKTKKKKQHSKLARSQCRVCSDTISTAAIVSLRILNLLLSSACRVEFPEVQYTMAKLTISAFIVVFAFAIVHLSVGSREIFRQSSHSLKHSVTTGRAPTETVASDVAVGNIITAPQHCPPGQTMDDRKICRKVL